MSRYHKVGHYSDVDENLFGNTRAKRFHMNHSIIFACRMLTVILCVQWTRAGFRAGRRCA